MVVFLIRQHLSSFVCICVSFIAHTNLHTHIFSKSFLITSFRTVDGSIPDGVVVVHESLLSLKFAFQLGNIYVEQELFHGIGVLFETVLIHFGNYVEVGTTLTWEEVLVLEDIGIQLQ